MCLFQEEVLRTRYNPLLSSPSQVPDGSRFIGLALSEDYVWVRVPAEERWHRQKGSWGEFNEKTVHECVVRLSKNQEGMVKSLSPALLPAKPEGAGKGVVSRIWWEPKCRRRRPNRTVAFCRETQPLSTNSPARRALEEWRPSLTSCWCFLWPTHVVLGIGFASI